MDLGGLDDLLFLASDLPAALADHHHDRHS